jgi:transketolase
MSKNLSISELEQMASQVRRDIVRMVHGAQSGHPGGSLGCADYFVALYFHILKHNAQNWSMDGVHEDLAFVSNGHVSPVWYSVLARSGYFEIEELKTFRNINSRLQGHPATEEGLPGIRVASGSLGQGLSVAVGAAQTKKLNNDESHVYVLMGDGEQQEGQIWEAVMFAAQNKVDNLIATIDYNHQQIDGPIESIISLDDLSAKYKAFNWEVVESDGNDMEDLVKNLKLAKSLTGKGKPVVNIMSTDMGKGVDFMEGTHKWHGIPPNDEQLASALAQLEETHGDY